MPKIKEPITILTIGDRPDHDSYRKFHKQKSFILKSGFLYETTSYKRFLKKGPPYIETKKIILFLFFPFIYWNEKIEYRHYGGIYGNRAFFTKFGHFWEEVEKNIRKYLGEKEILFVNRPQFCGLYRDKLEAAKKFKENNIPNPKLYNIRSVKKIEDLLNKGHAFFLKPRYGSMGKGITFLGWSNWQTNFIYRNNKIVSKRSDRGWKFTDVTGNRKFLNALLREKNMLTEEAIDSLILKKSKVDMRVYVFFNKVIYIYPRKNKADKITTNISQGAKGDPKLLKELPPHLVTRAKKIALRTSKALGVNFTGMDIMMDRNLRDVYVIDVNLFPGFPKRRTFDLAESMIKELKKQKRKLTWNSQKK